MEIEITENIFSEISPNTLSYKKNKKIIAIKLNNPKFTSLTICGELVYNCKLFEY